MEVKWKIKHPTIPCQITQTSPKNLGKEAFIPSNHLPPSPAAPFFPKKSHNSPKVQIICLSEKQEENKWRKNRGRVRKFELPLRSQWNRMFKSLGFFLGVLSQFEWIQKRNCQQNEEEDEVTGWWHKKRWRLFWFWRKWAKRRRTKNEERRTKNEERECK